MFFEEGWSSIADVTVEVQERVLSFHAEQAKATGRPVSQRRVMADVALSVWEICDAATKAGVTVAGGGLVPASKGLLAWEDPRSPINRHVDIRAGTVGSGGAAAGLSEAELRARYGAFLYLPLSVPQNGVESSLTFLEEELRTQAVRDEELLTVAARIIAASEAGETLTRGIARRTIGGALTRRKFKIAWALAADKRPELNQDFFGG